MSLQFLLQGVQVTHDTDNITAEIREQLEHFTLLHGGYVISPDTLTFKPATLPEKKCRSSKKS